MKTLLKLVCFCGILACSACASLRRETFDVVFLNVGNEVLVGTQIEFEGFNDAKGYLPVKMESRFTNFYGRFPSQATVRWRLAGPLNMPNLSATIPVPAERPPLDSRREQKYELRFEFDGTSATAKYEINDFTLIREYSRQQDREMRLVKPKKN